MATIQGINGNVAAVDGDARVLTQATTRRMVESANSDGRVFAVRVRVVPLATPGEIFFLYLRNLDTRDIIIKTWESMSGTASAMTMELVEGTPAFPSEILVSIANRNAGVSSPLAAIARGDKQITGLTSLGIVVLHNNGIAFQQNSVDLGSGVILPQGKAIALRRSAASTTPVDALLTIEVQK